MAAYQASLSLGFSRQEHWSGLPFPPPMHESEKWKWSRSVVSNSLRPHGLQPTRPLRPWDFLGKSTRVGCHCLLHYGSINTIYLLLVNTRVMTFYPLTLTLLVLSLPLASRQLSPGLLPISFLLLSNFLGMFIFLQATRCWQSSKTAP